MRQMCVIKLKLKFTKGRFVRQARRFLFHYYNDKRVGAGRCLAMFTVAGLLCLIMSDLSPMVHVTTVTNGLLYSTCHTAHSVFTSRTNSNNRTKSGLTNPHYFHVTRCIGFCLLVGIIDCQMLGIVQERPAHFRRMDAFLI